MSAALRITNAQPQAPHAHYDPPWPLGAAADLLWRRLSATVVITDHRSLARFARYCQLSATWSRAMDTIQEKGVAQTIKTGDGKAVREAKMMPHADYVLRVEAIMARLETEIEWRSMG